MMLCKSFLWEKFSYDFYFSLYCLYQVYQLCNVMMMGGYAEIFPFHLRKYLILSGGYYYRMSSTDIEVNGMYERNLNLWAASYKCEAALTLSKHLGLD